MFLWILRIVFLLTFIYTAIQVGLEISFSPSFVAPTNPIIGSLIPWAIFLTIVFVAVGVVGLDVFLKSKNIKSLSATYFGLLLGLLLGQLLSSALVQILMPRDEAVAKQWEWLVQPAQWLITLFFCYVCVSTLVQTKDEFRFIIPYVEFSKQIKGGRPLVLDTSVIIDGRIADICDTRVFDNKLVIPRFVLQELQSVADSADKLKRNRGRRGMDILKRMQSSSKLDIEIHEGNLPELREVREVDQRLVILAKSMGARVMTNDYNLNKVAQLQGVEVINLNELANALKSVALPGESMRIRMIKPGDQYGQGVGYLDDGTMVVAEQGRNHIGQDVNITVTSVLQTPAGRMIFGRVDERNGPATAAGQKAAEAT